MAKIWGKDLTTIAVTPETKKKLDVLKVHPRQSYNEVLENVLKLAADRTGRTGSE